jgi:hypothetical protein
MSTKNAIKDFLDQSICLGKINLNLFKNGAVASDKEVNRPFNMWV